MNLPKFTGSPSVKSGSFRNLIRKSYTIRPIEMDELRPTTLISWILAIILAWFFFQNGWPKLTGTEEVTTQFENWGYSGQFARIIGILECLGAVMVLIPRTAFFASIIFIAIMIGAIYTHVSTGIGSPFMAILLLVLAVAQLIVSKRNALFLSSRQ